MDIKETISVYEQIYFTHDLPVPFKEHLKIYPVLVKDYYDFYTMIDIFTINKNEDITGKGISMSHLDYLMYLASDENPSNELIKYKIIKMFELIFHIQNGIKCECDEDGDTFMSYQDIYKAMGEIEKKYQGDDSNAELSQQQILTEFYNLQKCPKCGKVRENVIRYNNLPNGKKDFIVDGVEITKDDYNLLRKVVCYQNMPDYDDEYIDPELKAEMEEAARLSNQNNVSPTLEKQESCIVASTSYTYETVKELSIRHLVMLLRTVDAKLHYFTYRQAEASGMVKFEKDALPHWIYSSDKKSKFDSLQSFDDFKGKFTNANVKM